MLVPLFLIRIVFKVIQLNIGDITGEYLELEHSYRDATGFRSPKVKCREVPKVKCGASALKPWSEIADWR